MMQVYGGMQSKLPSASGEALAGLTVGDVMPHQIAVQAVLRWQHIYARLAPIIGHCGMCALYHRSLYLVCSRFPWLYDAYAPDMDSSDFFGALRSALLQQTSAVSAAGDECLFATFRDLLVKLIGESLTTRLLSMVEVEFDRPARDGE